MDNKSLTKDELEQALVTAMVIAENALMMLLYSLNEKKIDLALLLAICTDGSLVHSFAIRDISCQNHFRDFNNSQTNLCYNRAKFERRVLNDKYISGGR